MPRTPKSPLTSIIAFAMTAPIDLVKQGIDTLKTIVKEREAAGLKEPALPLKVAKRRPRKAKPSPAAGAVASTTSVGPTEAAAPAPVMGRAQAEAAAQSPRRRRPPVGGPTPAAPAVAPVAAATTASTNGLPDQAVDTDHVE